MMKQDDIYKFQWAVCLQGYTDANDPYSDDHRSRGYFEPISTNLEYYDPDIKAPDLFLRLANLQHSHEAAYEFICNYGPLGIRVNESSAGSRIGYEAGQSVEELFNISNFFKSVLDDLKNKDVVKAANRFNFPIPGKTSLTAGIDTSNPKRPKYFVKPDSLYDFMGMQLAREIAGGLEWRDCKNPKCDKSFPISVGRVKLGAQKVGTMRKETCGSSACQKALGRLRAKERNSKKET